MKPMYIKLNDHLTLIFNERGIFSSQTIRNDVVIDQTAEVTRILAERGVTIEDIKEYREEWVHRG